MYTRDISEYEMMSFRHNCEVLARYPIVVVKPESLDLGDLFDGFPGVRFESFDDSFFKSIAGYNRLMMSEELYRRFSDSEYMLICQLDAWVFYDALLDWCEKGYDYVGAPWLAKLSHTRFPVSMFFMARKLINGLFGKRDRSITDNMVGNGGLSLRHVGRHLLAVTRMKDVVGKYLAHPGRPKYNEDVFFAIEPARHGLDFRYPDCMEALQFSFDKYPAYCWRVNGGNMPFGCHAWYKYPMCDFWFPRILGDARKCGR